MRRVAGALSDGDRTYGMLERNLALSPLWQIGRKAQERDELEREDLLGELATLKHGKLGEAEMDVLTWLIGEWWQQGAARTGVVTFTWYRLGRALFGKEPSGRHRALMVEAIDNLNSSIITLPGYDVVQGAFNPELASETNIVRHLSRPRHRSRRPKHAIDGGSRDGTISLVLEKWIVDQLLGDFGVALDWQVQRALGGLAKRLWAFLAAHGDFEPGAWPGEKQLVLEVTPGLLRTLDITAERPSKARARLASAGERIQRVDLRYVHVLVEREGRRPDSYRLRVCRRDAPLPAAGQAALPGVGA